MNRRYFLSSTIVLGAFAALSKSPSVFATFLQNGHSSSLGNKSKGIKKVTKPDEEWKRLLTPDQYAVTRQKGTEPPFTSPLNHIHQQGVFECVCCELPLFSSKAKFDSGTGWPSFYEPIAQENVHEEVDRSLSEPRTEVLCARCMEIIIIAFILIGAISAFVFRNTIPLSLIRIISFFSVLCLCLSIAGFVMPEYKMSLPFNVWYFAPLTMLLLILYLTTLPWLFAGLGENQYELLLYRPALDFESAI